MNKTKIEWVKNPDGTQGYTWNPITGCLNGCDYCYARKLANTRLKGTYLANKNVSPIKEGINNLCYDLRFATPFYPRFWEDRLDDPFLSDRNIGIKRHTRGQRQAPKGIFVCDMGELFGDWLPREWQEQVHLTITCNPQHRFYLLTKQPQNLIKFSPFPDNCWVGVTATDHEHFCQAGLALEKVSAKVKYLSVEPFLDWRPCPIDFVASRMNEIGIKQVIIGSQTKPYKPPKIEWVQEIALACTKAGIPLFLKNNLKSLLPNRMPFWNVVHWTEKDKGVDIEMAENRYRQEMPKGG